MYREYRPMVVWWCSGVAKGVTVWEKENFDLNVTASNC